MTNWKELRHKWKVDVRHGGYHVDGYFYQCMKAFHAPYSTPLDMSVSRQKSNMRTAQNCVSG